MDRIARLAGVRTAGSRFRVAWLAPLVLALVATTAWSAVQRGPRDVHIEKLHFDDQLMKVEVLEDFVVPLDIRLPALPALPSTPIIIPDMAIPPHIPAKIEFLHHNLEDMRIELENIALIRSRDMLEMQSMKVVRELIGGEIDSKEAVERLEALIRERDEALEKQKEERKAKEKAREKEKKKAD